MKCSDCDSLMNLKVCKSAAGYYIGYWCDKCGPYKRISDYYTTHGDAEFHLNNKTHIQIY